MDLVSILRNIQSNIYIGGHTVEQTNLYREQTDGHTVKQICIRTNPHRQKETLARLQIHILNYGQTAERVSK